MNNPMVFLIDDNNTMLALLGTLLSMEGFEISQLCEEQSIDQIMQSITNVNPDLILLDVHLQNIDGFDLLKSIRQDEKIRDVRVIMSSGMDYTTRCKAEGANGFILKPYMPEDLVDKIRRALAT
jgi:chemosensory pili system protein ChpA (sensor histidine kinase/response regulator)